MQFLTGLRGLLQRRRAHREIDAELAFHLDMETQANIDRGMRPAEARQTALRDFGGVTQARERVRDVRTLRIESLWRDVRYASRTLIAHPGFTATAAIMLALGIGLATSMFTIVDSLILRPVPFRDAPQLASIWMGDAHGGRTTVAPAVLEAWRASRAFDSAESAQSATAVLQVGDTVVARGIARVTPGVFDLLGGIRPIRGRLFEAAEGRPGQSDRVIISETLWRTIYHADPMLVGQEVSIDGERMTVVGILPATFRFPSADTVLWRPTDLSGRDERASAYVRFSRAVPRDDALRLAPDAARAADPTTAGLRPWLFPLAGLHDRYSRHALPLLAGCVILVFLILCANVCNLLLARLTTRRREFGLRAALGASRARLMRQAAIESGVLGALGLAGGVALAWAIVSVARTLIPASVLLDSLNPLDIDARALAATSVVAVIAVVAAGVLPAWLGTRVDSDEPLRVAERGGTEMPGARRVTRGLLVFEVALACTLLVAAMLLTRSFVNLAHADRGLDIAGVTTLWLALDRGGAPEPHARAALVRTLEDDLQSLPGVQRVAWSYGVPPDGGMISGGDWVSDLPGASPVRRTVARYVVSPEFFSLYQIPIVRGRTFVSSDRFDDVIVSERLADTLWPDVNPLGRTFRFQDERFHVIGVAREIHFPSIDPTSDGPEFYQPYTTIGNTAMVSLRCAPSCPDAAVIRYHLSSTLPASQIQRARPLGDVYERELARPRASAAVLMAFAVIALLASAGGLFSVLSYGVSRRRREFGIRTALGASPAQIRRLVVGDAVLVATLGLAVGAVAAAMLARALASLQYGVKPGDPVSWSIVLGLILLTAILASWAPARSAGRVDPALLLREE
jgi:predicted permease